jgi:hypothetical protein
MLEGLDEMTRVSCSLTKVLDSNLSGFHNAREISLRSCARRIPDLQKKKTTTTVLEKEKTAI